MLIYCFTVALHRLAARYALRLGSRRWQEQLQAGGSGAPDHLPSHTKRPCEARTGSSDFSFLPPQKQKVCL